MSEYAQTVVRAFDILYCFTEDDSTLSVAEVSRRVGLNRTTAYRLLSTLEYCHAVQRNASNGHYNLHPHLLQFASIIFRTSDLRTVAQEPMEQLWEDTGETVALHVRDTSYRIVFMQIESRHDLKATYPRMGEEIPLNLGAPSKAILAFLPEKEIQGFLGSGKLTRITSASITDVPRLLEEIEIARTRGYTLSVEERRRGVASIAAPIFDASGSVVAALNVIGPTIRLEGDRVVEVAALVKITAHTISERMGGSSTEDQGVFRR